MIPSVKLTAAGAALLAKVPAGSGAPVTRWQIGTGVLPAGTVGETRVPWMTAWGTRALLSNHWLTVVRKVSAHWSRVCWLAPAATCSSSSSLPSCWAFSSKTTWVRYSPATSSRRNRAVMPPTTG